MKSIAVNVGGATKANLRISADCYSQSGEPRALVPEFKDVEVVDLDFHAGCISARLAIGSRGHSDITLKVYLRRSNSAS
jgi:hypothetical protein